METNARNFCLVSWCEQRLPVRFVVRQLFFKNQSIFSSRHSVFSILIGQASNAFSILWSLFTLGGKTNTISENKNKRGSSKRFVYRCFFKGKKLAIWTFCQITSFNFIMKTAKHILLVKVRLQTNTLKEFLGNKSLGWKHIDVKATDELSSVIYLKFDSVRTFLDSDTSNSRLVEANLALPSFK